MSLFNRFLLKIATRFMRFERFAKSVFIRTEGGEIRSQSLRTLYKTSYRLDVGLYTYGCFTKGFNMGGVK